MAGMLDGTAMQRNILAALGLANPRHANDDQTGDGMECILDAMKALGIERVVYSLDGGGDEGQSVLSEVAFADGRDEQGLPDIPVGFYASGAVKKLDDALEDDAADRPDINWCDGNGGRGEVTYLPMAEEGERIECDVSPYEDEDDDDYDEIDEEVDLPDDEPVAEDDVVIPGDGEEDA